MNRCHLVFALVLSLLPIACTGAHARKAVSDSPGPAAGTSARLRVLTYNVHHGEGTDGRIDLGRIADLITSLDPDLVAVQEVDVRTRRSGGVDQAAELSRLTGLHPFFARIIDYQGGPYGLLVLSRHEPRSTASHELPYHPGEEPRRVAEVRVRVGRAGGGAAGRAAPVEVAFLCTHLDHRAEPVRMRQVERIEQIAAGIDAPLVLLAGDLNAEPSSPPMRRLFGAWRDAADGGGPDGPGPDGPGPDGLLTYPSAAPVKRIDYVLYRPSPRLRVVERRVIDERVASDHRPVLAVFEVATGRAATPDVLAPCAAGR